MAEQSGPRNDEELEELREAAEEVGVDDVEGKDADELVHDAQEAGEDSAASPTQWKVDPDDAQT